MPLRVQAWPEEEKGPDRVFVHYGVLICAVIAVMFGLEMIDEAGLIEGKLQMIEVVVQVMLMCLVGVAAPRLVHELKRRRTATIDALESRGRIELLFKMTGMLQCTLGHDDANAVL